LEVLRRILGGQWRGVLSPQYETFENPPSFRNMLPMRD
jgi:hypothetical protein